MNPSAASQHDLFHDLRNPLAAMYTAATLLSELPPETQLSAVDRHIGLIMKAVEQAQAVLVAAEKVAEPPSEGAAQKDSC